MYKLSIIVPVYNVEKYLEACLDSIYSDITPDCQVILVDDGATDKSGEICDRYAKDHCNTTVIHQENAGLGGARNTGIEAANGEYLCFVDSDDTLTDGALKTVLSDIEAHGADITVYPMRVVGEDGRIICTARDGGFEAGRHVPEDEKGLICIAPAACNKIFKASLFADTGVRFPSKVWYEDIRTTPKLASRAGSMVFSDTPIYNYLRREGSIMNSSKVERNIEIVSAMDDLLEWFKANGIYDSYREELDFLIIDHVLLTATVRVIRAAGTSHELIARFRTYTKENCRDIKKNRYVAQMPKNRRLVLGLLQMKLYAAVSLLFKIKK